MNSKEIYDQMIKYLTPCLPEGVILINPLDKEKYMEIMYTLPILKFCPIINKLSYNKSTDELIVIETNNERNSFYLGRSVRLPDGLKLSTTHLYSNKPILIDNDRVYEMDFTPIR